MFNAFVGVILVTVNKFAHSLVALAMIILTLPMSALAQPQSNCGADPRPLYLKALEKVAPRVLTERSVKPDDLTYERLLPTVIVGRYFRSFPTPEAFLAANPSCCSLGYDFTGFEFVDPNWFQVTFMGAPDIRSENSVVVHIKVSASTEVAGRRRTFNKQYDIVLDRCARDLNVGRFDISILGTIEEQ